MLGDGMDVSMTEDGSSETIGQDAYVETLDRRSCAMFARPSRCVTPFLSFFCVESERV